MPKNLKGKRATVLKVMIPVALFIMAAILVSLFWPSGTEASGPLATNEYEAKAFEEAKKLIPEAESMEKYQGTYPGSGMDLATYSLKDKEGNGICILSADPLTGEVVCFYDCRQQGPSSEVLISLEQARNIAEQFLLENGIDVKAGQVTLTSEKLKSSGMEGPPDNPIQTFEYSFEFRETVNGMCVTDGTAAAIGISPKDGRIIGYSIDRKTSTSTDPSKEVGMTNISKEEAVDIAIKTAREKFQLSTQPYIPGDIVPAVADLGDGHLTPYISTSLFFADHDISSMEEGTCRIGVVVSLETGEILHIAIIDGGSAETSGMAQ